MGRVPVTDVGRETLKKGIEQIPDQQGLQRLIDFIDTGGELLLTGGIRLRNSDKSTLY